MIAEKERIRDTSKKRRIILRAARDCFIEDGYDRASMDKIAQIADASKRTVYNHFPSKDDLFQAVLEDLAQECTPANPIRYDSKRALKDQLADFVNVRLKNLDNPGWLGMVRVTLGVLIQNPDLAKRTFASGPGDEGLIAWLRDAQADGKLNPFDAKYVAEIFWAMIGGGLMWPVFFNGPMKPKDVAKTKQELIRIFLASYATSRGNR